MKNTAIMAIAIVMVMLMGQTKAQTTKLFMPDMAHEWHTFLAKSGRNSDPLKVFDFEKNVLHVSGEEFGYAVTEKSYKEFHLSLEFKWGEKKYPPRENDKRDAGILYFVQNTKGDKVWPQAIEFQIQEGDCGDFWLVDNVGLTYKDTVVAGKDYYRIVKLKNAENPNGQWNKAEVIVKSNTITHLLNGEIVNQGTNPTISEGKILIQSEGAEIYYKNVTIETY